MANLLLTQQGRQTLNRVACSLGRRRMSKRLHRAFMIAFQEYRVGGHFSVETMLNSLNPIHQDEIAQIDTLLGELGCHDQLWADRTIYVDAANGDDTTGDGSEAQPYASFGFVESLPKNVFRNILILIKGDISIEWMNWNHVIGEKGSITIAGHGAPNVVTTSAGAGPFTVTGLTAHGSPPAAYQFTVAETFGVDELYGKWIRFETGNAAGQILPVHNNTANDLWTRIGWSPAPSNGDTFVIVEPSTTVSCQAWNLECSGPKNVLDANSEASRFSLWNMKIDIAGAFNERNHFVVRNSCRTMLSFVQLNYDTGISDFCKLECDINQNSNYNTAAAAEVEGSIANLDKGVGAGSCCGFSLYRASGPTVGSVECTIQGAAKQISAIDSNGLLSVRCPVNQLNFSAFTVVECAQFSSGGFYNNYVLGYVGSSSIYLYQASGWHVGYCHLEGGGNMFKVVIGKLLLTPDTISKGTFTGHGFVFDKGNGQVVVDGNPAALVGTAGALYFAGGVGTLAFPAADAMQTDSLGNTFARIETP